jgi:transcriptional/translational regulatory protein YebC/TACO1
MELALEAGAEDFRADEHGFEIITEPQQFEAIHKQLEAKGVKFEAAEVTAIPSLSVPVSESAATAVSRLIDALEEHDDVKEVYSNAEFAEN